MIGYILSALIALVASASELTARYKDAPKEAITTGAGIGYILLNMIAALTAYYLLLDVFVVSFGLDPVELKSDKGTAYRVFSAGLGSLAFFRSSLFNVQVGDTEIAAGPAGILQIFLGASDRAVDRARAAPRAKEISDLMKGVDFSKAYQALPAFCFEIMQNVTAEEQQQLATSIDALNASQNISDNVKAYLLGLSLLNIVGKDVLEAAVKTLGDEIRA